MEPADALSLLGKAWRCAANLGALSRGKKSLLAPPIAG
jgi:hypothetical protein